MSNYPRDVQQTDENPPGYLEALSRDDSSYIMPVISQSTRVYPTISPVNNPQSGYNNPNNNFRSGNDQVIGFRPLPPVVTQRSNIQHHRKKRSSNKKKLYIAIGIGCVIALAVLGVLIWLIYDFISKKINSIITI